MFPQWMVGNQGAVRQDAGPLVTCHALPDASTPLGSKVAHRLPAACLACAPADMPHVESAESRDVQRLTTPITMPHTRVHPMAMKVSVTTLAMLTNYSTGGHGKTISLPLSYDTTAGRAPDFVAAAGAAALQMDTLQPHSSSSSGCHAAPITNRCACRRWLRCRTPRCAQLMQPAQVRGRRRLLRLGSPLSCSYGCFSLLTFCPLPRLFYLRIGSIGMAGIS